MSTLENLKQELVIIKKEFQSFQENLNFYLFNQFSDNLPEDTEFHLIFEDYYHRDHFSIKVRLTNKKYFWCSSKDFEIIVKEDYSLDFDYKFSDGGREKDVTAIDTLRVLSEYTIFAIRVFEFCEKNKSKFISQCKKYQLHNNKIDEKRIEIREEKARLEYEDKKRKIDLILGIFSKPKEEEVDTLFKELFGSDDFCGSFEFVSAYAQPRSESFSFSKNVISFEKYNRLSIMLDNSRISKKDLFEFILQRGLLFQNEFFTDIKTVFPQATFSRKKQDGVLKFSTTISKLYEEVGFQVKVAEF